MTDPAQLARARALLARTADLIAAVEAELDALRAENLAAQERVLAWEETLAALLPDAEVEAPFRHVEAVHDEDGGVVEEATDGGSVYTLATSGARTIPRE